MSGSNQFQAAASVLFQEAFEGVRPGQNYTWFVQGREGIFDALDSMDAARASKPPSDRSSTVAAHAYHLLFTLRSANEYLGRPEPEGTWESSWEKQDATDSEWQELKGEIRAEYELHLDWLTNNLEWEKSERVIGPLAVLPHVSYHLGAMRQILNTV